MEDVTIAHDTEHEAAPPDPQALPTIAFDAERYRPHVADLNLSAAREEELLRTLWDIMSAFVDIGWGVDSVQNLLPFLREEFSAEAAPLLECEDSPPTDETPREARTAKDERE